MAAQREDDGTLGRDAQMLLKRRGSLTGFQAWLPATMSQVRSLPGTDYRGVDMSTADLSDQWLRRYDLRRATLRLATLDGAHLLRCDLRNADLRGASLRTTRLLACDLRGADLRDVDLRGAQFDRAQGSTAFEGCRLSGASLDGVTWVDCTYAAETDWPVDFDPGAAGLRCMSR